MGVECEPATQLAVQDVERHPYQETQSFSWRCDMVTLKDAAQQALDYIRSTTDYKMGHPPACEAALDLADALAEPQEPYCYHDGRDIVGKEFAHHSDVFPLFTAPQPKAEPQEPVGWLYEGIASHTRGKSVFKKTREMRLETRWWQEKGPLYTAPQPRREPLTDEQIEKLREKTFSTGNPYCPVDSKSMRKAARAIEAAHGITGETK
jgi:hypothetical protein